ncbi:UNVERIFIED_CONTAM: hypothetical protein FKN15_022396 [Acipenser sinensis]
MGRRPARCYRYCKNKPYPKSRFCRGVPVLPCLWSLTHASSLSEGHEKAEDAVQGLGAVLDRVTASNAGCPRYQPPCNNLTQNNTAAAAPPPLKLQDTSLLTCTAAASSRRL